ncbi:DUF3726 domain-containing protein [Ruegeria halocynthiae]|uniref:DUF3726 domain-containing protein n=1 Tax=Ruegeria halocynthiae TaxID=985054 RepID=UPI0005654183|nr:DUF3726 domain-containing protein [Ruegeria halocynthiae]
MSFSLNEVEVTAKRAARGAGYSWGLAEEAGKAARWLCVQGIDGVAVMAQILAHDLARTPQTHVPADPGNHWAGQKALCPLATGALLSDCADRLNVSTITLENVAAPTLLLPFSANAARMLKSCVTVACDVSEVVTDGYDLAITSAIPNHAERVTVRIGGILTKTRPHHSRATPDPEDWAALTRFAHRTYAPATEESRLLGAGAGLSDND